MTDDEVTAGVVTAPTGPTDVDSKARGTGPAPATNAVTDATATAPASPDRTTNPYPSAIGTPDPARTPHTSR